MNEKAYKAYYRMQEIETKHMTLRSDYRHKKDFETAAEHGEAASTIRACMRVLVDEFGLKFER